MNLSEQIAKHLREVYFGGNWTGSNLKDNLAGINWQQATKQVYSCNSIATLVYHINYYVVAQIKVFQGLPLDAHDKFSFDLPPITSQEGWDKLMTKELNDGETLIRFISEMPDTVLEDSFANEKYGNYFRNLHGMIEHTHYHLGQIAILRKIIIQVEEK